MTLRKFVLERAACKIRTIRGGKVQYNFTYSMEFDNQVSHACSSFYDVPGSTSPMQKIFLESSFFH
jgi:hypothetical protein